MNNGTLTGIKSMPQKDLTSDGQNSFSLGRRIFTETFQPEQSIEIQKQKKWYGNRDASQITANKRNLQIGEGSLNASGELMSFTTHNTVNTINNALRRVRSSGSVAPPKKGGNPRMM